MNKKLVLGLALAVVLVSGAFFGARADCGCVPHISVPTCCSCGASADHDRDLGGAGMILHYDYGPDNQWAMAHGN